MNGPVAEIGGRVREVDSFGFVVVVVVVLVVVVVVVAEIGVVVLVGVS